MRVLQRDGISFNYVDQHWAESGTAEQLPFVFQHGIGGTLSQPTGVMDPLPEGVRLLSMDARGHGETTPVGAPARFSFETFADDVLALLDHVGVARAVIGGISMGAGVALNLALRHPGRVAGLVISRPAWLDGPMAALGHYQQIATLLRDYGPVEGKRRFSDSGDFVTLREESPDAARSLLGQFDEPRALEGCARLETLPYDRPFASLADLASVEVKTLVLATDHDPVHPRDYGRAVAENIPGARFHQVTSKSESAEAHTKEMYAQICGFLAEIRD